MLAFKVTEEVLLAGQKLKFTLAKLYSLWFTIGIGIMQYAERLPIGTEAVIRTVSAETVKQFYQKWYQLCHMAVVAVGDFPDTQVWCHCISTFRV